MDLGFADAIETDHLNDAELRLIETILDRAEVRRQNLAKLDRSPVTHLRAGHSVVAFWPTDTKGYLQLFEGSDDIDVYDTESLDAGETDEIRCNTCDTPLDLVNGAGEAYI
jgi:hypothetical protein